MDLDWTGVSAAISALECGTVRGELNGTGDCGSDAEVNRMPWEEDLPVMRFKGVSASLAREEEVESSASRMDVAQSDRSASMQYGCTDRTTGLAVLTTVLLLLPELMPLSQPLLLPWRELRGLWELFSNKDGLIKVGSVFSCPIEFDLRSLP